MRKASADLGVRRVVLKKSLSMSLGSLLRMSVTVSFIVLKYNGGSVGKGNPELVYPGPAQHRG